MCYLRHVCKVVIPLNQVRFTVVTRISEVLYIPAIDDLRGASYLCRLEYVFRVRMEKRFCVRYIMPRRSARCGTSAELVNMEMDSPTIAINITEGSPP
jgi:hypothetical protein